MTDIRFSNISDSTAKARLSYLRKMGINTLEDYRKLENPTRIVREYVKDSKVPTTQRTRIWMIIEFLKLIPEASQLKEDYISLAQPILADAIKHVENNKLRDDPRSDTYIPIEELREKWSLKWSQNPQIARSCCILSPCPKQCRRSCLKSWSWQMHPIPSPTS
jgi:hypothetical protein